MITAKYKSLIGAAIVMFFLAGTAWADGNRGRDHKGGGPGYHHGYRQHNGPDFRRPAPHRHPRYFGPRDHRGPRYHHGPGHRHGYAYPYPGHRHPRSRVYRSHAPYTGYGLHLSVFDPYFMFGFSTGGRW